MSCTYGNGLYIQYEKDKVHRLINKGKRYRSKNQYFDWTKVQTVHWIHQFGFILQIKETRRIDGWDKYPNLKSLKITSDPTELPTRLWDLEKELVLSKDLRNYLTDHPLTVVLFISPTWDPSYYSNRRQEVVFAKDEGGTRFREESPFFFFHVNNSKMTV